MSRVRNVRGSKALVSARYCRGNPCDQRARPVEVLFKKQEPQKDGDRVGWGKKKEEGKKKERDDNKFTLCCIVCAALHTF